jgi:signal transduction histidine kinase
LGNVERLLLAGAAAVIASTWLFTAWSVADDRALTRETSFKVAASLAAGLEEHTNALLRDGINAAHAAARLAEQRGGFASWSTPSRLHEDLRRELWDRTSVARLLAVDAEGRVVASSAEPALPALSAARDENFAWHRQRPADRAFHIGMTRASAVDGKLAIPVSTRVEGADGGFLGMVVAEVSVEYMQRVYRELTDEYPAVVVIVDPAGRRLIRFPLAEGFIGRSIAAHEVPLADILAGPINLPVHSQVAGRDYLFAFRPIRGHPLALGVGLDQERAMQPWAGRAWQRATMMAIGTVFFMLLAALVFHALRRARRGEQRLHDLNASLERRVAERTAELTRLIGELEAFSSSVSHDLRAPLRRIAGFAELAREAGAGAQRGELARHLRTIEAEVARMDALVDDLLKLAHVSRAEMRSSEVDLGRLVEEVRRGLGSTRGDTPVRWILEPLPTVRGDRGLLLLAVTNLLANAVKYSRGRSPATIEVGAEPALARPGEVVVRIRDNGVGFDMAHAGRLFGVFQRLHGDHEFEGTGIGLANVKRIVERHGGRVWAEAAPGAGATFYMALPK